MKTCAHALEQTMRMLGTCTFRRLSKLPGQATCHCCSSVKMKNLEPMLGCSLNFSNGSWKNDMFDTSSQRARWTIGKRTSSTKTRNWSPWSPTLKRGSLRVRRARICKTSSGTSTFRFECADSYSFLNSFYSFIILLLQQSTVWIIKFNFDLMIILWLYLGY